MKRIVFLAPSVKPITKDLDYGGAELCLLNLVECLSEKGYEIVVYAPKESNFGDKVEVIPTIEANENWQNEESVYSKFVNDIFDSKNDIIISFEHDGIFLRNDYPIIQKIHGLTTWDNLGNIQLNSKLVFESQYQLTYSFFKWGELLPNSTCINIGINLNDYKPTLDKKDYALSFGLIQPHKGHEQAIKLFRGYLRDYVSELIIAGEDQFVADLKYPFKFKKLCEGYDGVRYLGRVSKKKKIDLMSKAKVVLLMFQIPEAYSIILTEALASATPVITTSIPVIHELRSLDDKLHPILFPNEIDKLSYPELNNDCLTFAQKHFSRELMAERWEKFINS